MTHEKVLLLEDDQDIIEVVSIILTGKGYQCIAQNTAANLFNKIDEVKPSVILLDGKVGEYDGRELCNEIKTQQAFNHIPVLLFSADTRIEQDAAQYPFDGYIKKPFEMHTLIETIAKYTGGSMQKT